ncbi:glycoside hydrolase superfamily [Aspergillus cavernicola]|uniref:Alpha-glucuronidase n=1 Tax=Aspergillus cavernicola TaxID=176166 RepID=A0ABR4IJ01_9EURO
MPPMLETGGSKTGIDGWLRYAKLPAHVIGGFKPPTDIIVLDETETSPVFTAGAELKRGIKGIFGEDVTTTHGGCGSNSASVVIGTIDAYARSCNLLSNMTRLTDDGFWLSVKGKTVHILGQNERGALYGTFEFLARLAQGNFSTISYASNPEVPIRWTNEWDNMDGSIERGYGGRSIFFANDTVLDDLKRVSQYSRLLASVKINGVIFTNVNADPVTLTPHNIKGLGRIADAMRPYGVQIGVALNFASPQTLGGLPTYDPLDKRVILWWSNITDSIYAQIPDFGGYLVKASSEGQPGPHQYNRTLPEGANLFGDILRPHGGITLFRAFVYDLLDIADWKADRAAEAYNAFQGLDGKFHDKVILQIKYGPLDFQGREPPSPLFGYFEKSNQSHTVYLPPLWKTIFDADLRVNGETSYVRDIISGKRFKRRLGGFSGVANVGHSLTWMGSHLSMSNLYAFGRMAWDPTEDPDAIIQDWSRLTFGVDPVVTDVVHHIAMASWPAYQHYTSGDIGLPSLTDVTGNHFGPNVRAGDDNEYGIWTRSDSFSIGMDRTSKNGSGFAGQYPPEYAEKVENVETTPVEFLLWYHHVNNTYELPWGRTVIQHLYDAHYSGAETAQTFPNLWKKLDGKVNTRQYKEVLAQLTFQAGHAVVWRDSIVDYYHNLTQISDDFGRVGNHPWRIEAESMELTGYKPIGVDPIESASNALAVAVTRNMQATAEVALDMSPGTWNIAIVYFDITGGVAQWEASLNDKSLGTWLRNSEYVFSHEGTDTPDGGSKTRITFENVNILDGDVLKVVSKADGWDAGVFDYVAVFPAGIID